MSVFICRLCGSMFACMSCVFTIGHCIKLNSTAGGVILLKLMDFAVVLLCVLATVRKSVAHWWWTLYMELCSPDRRTLYQLWFLFFCGAKQLTTDLKFEAKLLDQWQNNTLSSCYLKQLTNWSQDCKCFHMAHLWRVNFFSFSFCLRPLACCLLELLCPMKPSGH